MGRSDNQDPADGPDGTAQSDPNEATAHLNRITLGTAAAGIAFSILFVLSVAILSRTPGPRASDDAIAAFYGGPERRLLVIVGFYLLPISAIAFLWFVAVLREWVSGGSRRINQLLSNVQLLSGIAFITLALAASAAMSVAAFETEFSNVALDPAEARQFPLLGNALLYVFAMRMAALFVTSTIGIVRGSGIFTRWFQVVSYLVAACLFLVATHGPWLAFVFPAWVAVLSVIMIYRRHSIAALVGVARV